MDLIDIDKKIVGYALLAIGLIIIFYSLITVIDVFTGGEVPLEILKSSQSEESMQTTIDPQTGNVTMEGMDLATVIEPLFPILNMMGWLAIAFFIVFAGGTISKIGIKTLKSAIPDVKIVKKEIAQYKDQEKNISNEKQKEEKKKLFGKK